MSQGPAADVGVEDVEALRSRDPAGLTSLVLRYDSAVRAFVQRFARNPDEAEDLVQETWIRVWEQGPSFRATGHVKSWLLRICRTVCVRTVRARWPECPLEDVGAPPAPSEQDFHDEQEREEAYVDAVMSLPPRRRLVFLMRVFCEYSTEDTAAALGCSPGTVKAALHAGRRELREKFSRDSR